MVVVIVIIFLVAAGFVVAIGTVQSMSQEKAAAADMELITLKITMKLSQDPSFINQITTVDLSGDYATKLTQNNYSAFKQLMENNKRIKANVRIKRRRFIPKGSYNPEGEGGDGRRSTAYTHPAEPVLNLAYQTTYSSRIMYNTIASDYLLDPWGYPYLIYRSGNNIIIESEGPDRDVPAGKWSRDDNLVH